MARSSSAAFPEAHGLDELERAVRDIGGNRASDLTFAPRWHGQEIDGVAEALDALLKRVRIMVERERRVVADMSHELRTPLTVIRGQLELLASEPDAQQREPMLRAAQRSCDALVCMTESLLALAREEASLVEAVEIGDVVEDVRAAQVALGGLQRLVIDATAPALVRGDPHLLRLAINNVVDNALKYSCGRVTVRVTAPDESSAGGVVTWTVEDEGPGIPEAEVASVVKPFARGSGTAQRGTGLGLALVDHVARIHGGALALSVSRAHGLKVTVTLPAWTAGNHDNVNVKR